MQREIQEICEKKVFNAMLNFLQLIFNHPAKKLLRRYGSSKRGVRFKIKPKAGSNAPAAKRHPFSHSRTNKGREKNTLPATVSHISVMDLNQVSCKNKRRAATSANRLNGSLVPLVRGPLWEVLTATSVAGLSADWLTVSLSDTCKTKEEMPGSAHK